MQNVFSNTIMVFYVRFLSLYKLKININHLHKSLQMKYHKIFFITVWTIKPDSVLFFFFTSARLLALRSSVCSRALFSRPSTLVKWLWEQLRWRRVYMSLSPVVVISSLWSSDSFCSLFIDSRPAENDTQYEYGHAIQNISKPRLI